MPEQTPATWGQTKISSVDAAWAQPCSVPTWAGVHVYQCTAQAHMLQGPAHAACMDEW